MAIMLRTRVMHIVDVMNGVSLVVLRSVLSCSVNSM